MILRILKTLLISTKFVVQFLDLLLCEQLICRKMPCMHMTKPFWRHLHAIAFCFAYLFYLLNY